ncbi:MAG: 3-deoxy-7-phosphoheptulonate synthase [Candidatus Saccharimonadales bacterium]
MDTLTRQKDDILNCSTIKDNPSLSGSILMPQNKLINTRVLDVISISSPDSVIADIPQSDKSEETVLDARKKIVDIISRKSKKIMVVIGPCSVHDPKAAIEYAEWLKNQREKHSEDLEIVMRAYLEKPRTTIGWKGIINDPHLDGSGHMDEGVRIARKLLQDITSSGVPVATELLDIRTPQYVADLISWGAIGARTIESQLHRELVSGISFPVGMKNGTGGGIQIAIDAMNAAENKHSFIGIDMDGQTAIIKTSGNKDTFIILRGSKEGPNYSADSVRDVVEMLKDSHRNTSVMIDCSHANSGKDYRKQPVVAKDVAGQIAAGDRNIIGVMIESNLNEGSQSIGDGKDLEYGKSITDACVGLSDSEKILDELAEAVRTRG